VSKPTIRGARVLIAAFSVLSLVAAACGDDDDADEGAATTGGDSATTAGDTGTTAGGATTTAGETGTTGPATTGGETGTTGPATTGGAAEPPTGTPVKIGVIYAETGRTGAVYNMIDDVANAWAEWVNTEQGGVGGHPVEIVAADDESTGEGAVAAARDLVESQGVVAVVIQDSAAETATLEYLSEQGVPFIGGTNNNRPIDGGETSWPNTHFVMSPSNPGTAAGPLLAAQAIGQTAFGAAVCAEVPACAQAGQLYEPVAQGLGIEYVGLVTVGAADPSYTAPCLELIGNNADYINLVVDVATGLKVVEECTLQGYEGVFGAANNTVIASEFEAQEGIRLAGVIHGFPWWADAPPVETYNSVTEAAGVDGRNPSATSTWAALELFRTAMGEFGPAADAEVTAADVVAAYYQVQGETLDGLLAAPISFVAEGPQPYVPCFWLYDMQDGEFSTVTVGDSGNGVSGDLQSSCFSPGG
jgi:branched-chain amino acid transport system substrate-binding protein